MGRIGGNIDAVIQIQTATNNRIGEDELEWVDALPSFKGWLDLLDEDSRKPNYRAKLQESTHIFLCDYIPLVTQREQPGNEITPESSRMIVDGKVYDVVLYDDPMGMHEHLEIYLKYRGGQ